MEPLTLESIFGLGGRRALVTGASTGLGVEFAEALAIAGADVALVARREDLLRDVAARLAAYRGRVAVIPADLAVADAAVDVFDRCEAELGPIDILVNNAGRHQAIRAERVTPEQWREVIALNLDAVFALCQEFARRRFRDGGDGRIINVGSVIGAVASSTPGLAAYAAAKGGLAMLTRQLAIEWGPRRITVNTIAPAYFPTELNAKDFENAKIRERIETFTPLGRLGQPGELRAALLFLASPAASYVTGATVFVDGGYTAW
jgi:NAD(P)-dependent dehydrogenase (short-subunit alcohol dehydrogenase family)